MGRWPPMNVTGRLLLPRDVTGRLLMRLLLLLLLVLLLAVLAVLAVLAMQEPFSAKVKVERISRSISRCVVAATGRGGDFSRRPRSQRFKDVRSPPNCRKSHSLMWRLRALFAPVRGASFFDFMGSISTSRSMCMLWSLPTGQPD